MKHFFYLFCAFAVVACGETGPKEIGWKTLSVKEFLYDYKLTNLTRGWCAEKDAERQSLDNCINAKQAGEMIATGKFKSCYKRGGLVDYDCVDAAMAVK